MSGRCQPVCQRLLSSVAQDGLSRLAIVHTHCGVSEDAAPVGGRNRSQIPRRLRRVRVSSVEKYPIPQARRSAWTRMDVLNHVLILRSALSLSFRLYWLR